MMMMMSVLCGIELGKDRREFRVNLQLGSAQLLVKRLSLLMQRLELVRRCLVGNESLELLLQVMLLRFQAGIRRKNLLLGALQLGSLGIGQD